MSTPEIMQKSSFCPSVVLMHTYQQPLTIRHERMRIANGRPSNEAFTQKCLHLRKRVHGSILPGQGTCPEHYCTDLNYCFLPSSCGNPGWSPACRNRSLPANPLLPGRSKAPAAESRGRKRGAVGSEVSCEGLYKTRRFLYCS